MFVLSDHLDETPKPFPQNYTSFCVAFVIRDFGLTGLRWDTGAVSSADISGFLAGWLTAVCSIFTVSSALLAFLLYISIMINMASDRGKSRQSR